MASKRRKDDADMSEDETTPAHDIVNVDFEFFDIQSQDYHAIHNLLKQLLSHDAVRFDLGKLADILLEQNYVGSTVKCDGHESDPYAFCSVLNLNTRREEKAIADLTSYLLDRAGTSTLHATLAKLLASTADTDHLGLVLSERLVNMPPQIVTPMFRMLEEELQWAIDENEPYRFSHLLFLSRVYVSAGGSDDGTNGVTPPRSKKKKGGGERVVADAAPGDVFAYHAEDEVIGKFAEATVDFDYAAAPERDAVDPFGVETRGRLMLVPADKLGELVTALDHFFAAAA